VVSHPRTATWASDCTWVRRLIRMRQHRCITHPHRCITPGRPTTGLSTMDRRCVTTALITVAGTGTIGIIAA